MRLSRLWRTFTGDLPHPSEIMRQWFLGEDAGQPVVRLCLVAGQEAPHSVLVQAAAAMRSEGVVINHLVQEVFGGAVHGKVGDDDIRVQWGNGSGIVLLIVTGVSWLLSEAEREDLSYGLDQFTRYREGDTYTDDGGPSPRVRDSADAIVEVATMARLLRQADSSARAKQSERQAEAKHGRSAIRYRTGLVNAFLVHAAEVLAASGFGLLVVSSWAIFDPDHKQAAMKGFAFSAILLMAGAQILLIGRRFWPILGAAVGGTLGFVIVHWPQLEMLGYAGFVLEMVLYAWMLPLHRAALQAKRT
ncbi:hypothetical protein [Nocardia australiensis]|uniref:hypothetical protein n=1 Tax=Nocardia australiensis TaxID=2887191 RepID=UPI001D141EA4|nr:hypothetical protein [Nocardia australiensis]